MVRDPLANPGILIERLYAYVSYRIGSGPEAEDVTSEVLERALRYRKSYDPAKGAPISWLIGIARRCLDGRARSGPAAESVAPDLVSSEDVEEKTIRRIMLAEAIAGLSTRSQDLIALRYGADLTARQIGEVLGLRTNAVEVALQRALARLGAAMAPPAEEEVEGLDAQDVRV